ncbi:MAG: hypothetical protein R3B48_17980 [Kofleriaceae bacterium]
MAPVGLALGAAALGVGCDWREFDDLGDTAWVDTAGAPGGVDSSDFAVGLAEANNEAANETRQLAVISRSKLTLAFLSYNADGARTVRQSISLDSNSGGPFESLPQSPVYAADPASGRIAVAGNGKIAIGDPSKANLDVATAPNSANSAGVTFLTLGGETFVAAATERGVALINVSTPTTTTEICTAPAGISRIVALGTSRSGAGDRLVIWSENSPMMRSEIGAYAVTVTVGTMCALTPSGALDTSLSLPTRADYPLIEGARIISLPGSDAVAVADPLKGMVSVFTFAATPQAQTFAAPGVTSLAVGQLGADTYLFAGASNQSVDAVSNAGRMQATKLTGVAPAATPALTLHDASPETEQRFGRAVAVIPFTDATSPIVVVGADNELFTYFRTGLYDERRVR